MKAAHTPGPWIFRERPDEACDMGGFFGPDGEEVMHFGNGDQYCPSEGRPPNDANAALVAAAPMLAEAVGRLMRHYDESNRTTIGVGRTADIGPTIADLDFACAAIRAAGRLL